jgi:hypothetical protein
MHEGCEAGVTNMGAAPQAMMIAGRCSLNRFILNVPAQAGGTAWTALPM